MPRVVVKVQNAPIKTRWTTASQQQLKPRTIDAKDIEAAADAHAYMMQPNGGGGNYHYHDAPLPRYESYDSTRQVSPNPPSRNPFGDYDYNTPIEQRASHQISVDTRMRISQQLQQQQERQQRQPGGQDVVGQHMLYETALMDSSSYEMLSMAEVDALKKEQARLIARLDAAHRKLALENKVRDAARNLQRLYAVGQRPDTPQTPDSPRRNRASVLSSTRNRSSGSLGVGGAQSLTQAEEELAISEKKVEEVKQIIAVLQDRRQYVEKRLLRHTSAILAEQAARAQRKISGRALTNGNHHAVEEHEEPEPRDSPNMYSPDEYDGIRDILRGSKAPSTRGGKTRAEYEQQMQSVQSRLEQLNHQLRTVISEVSMARGVDLEPEPETAQVEDISTALDKRFGKVEANIQLLLREQQGVKAHYAQIEHDAALKSNAVEEQLDSVNRQLHHVLLLGVNETNPQSLREPPQVTGHGCQSQVSFLEESIMTMEQILQQYKQEAHDAREIHSETRAKASSHAQKVDEYEATLGGLWDILQSGPESRVRSEDQDDDDTPLPSPGTPLKEDFSLQAFSARVQHVFDRAQMAQEQQQILRRQIQQQRELNGKSDAGKDAQVASLTEQREQLETRAEELQEKITGLEAQVTEMTDDARLAEVEAQAKIREAAAKHDDLNQQLGAAVTAKEDAEHRHTSARADLNGLESEVVRLTTELTMAKAELEGAYGSRAERAKEAQAAEVAGLTERNKQISSELESLRGQHEDLKTQAKRSDRVRDLEQELTELANDFQALTKESVEMEKERSQLEDLIDGLRDRVDTLESHLSDEKVRWLGIKSPSGTQEALNIGRELTSTMVIRQEFKKMMRETRAEGMKLLKAEQDHRRRVEAELRRLRQANGPLAPKINDPTTAAAAVQSS